MSDRCAAASGAGPLARAAPPACSEPGSEVSLGDFLQYLVMHRQVGYRPAQSGVLLLKFLQMPGLINLESAVFLAPPVIDVIHDPQLLPYFLQRLALGFNLTWWSLNLRAE